MATEYFEEGLMGQRQEFKMDNEVLKDLKAKCNLIANNLVQSDTQLQRFLRDPLEYLYGFDMRILKLIEGPTFSKQDLNNSLKKIVEQPKPYFVKCIACKLAVIIILYAVLAHFGVTELGASLDALKTFVDKLNDFFAGTAGMGEGMLSDLADVLKALSPWDIALSVCRALGFCGA